jgi:signal transduction histidine kinase
MVAVMRTVARHGADALVVVLLALALLDVVFSDNNYDTVLVYLFPFGWTLPLLLRRRTPAVAALAVMACLALEAQVAEPATESLVALPAALWAFWIAGSMDDRLRALTVGAACAVLAAVLVASDPGSFSAGDAAFVVILAATPFAVGMITHDRERRSEQLLRDATDAAREQQERSRAAVAAERAQIARELHDVVGHAISVMTVQAGAARMLMTDDPGRARESLLAVEDAGRQALAEMRRMLEILRADDGAPSTGPRPGLGDLDGLLQQVRDSGVPVELTVEGDPVELAPGVDLAAYRVIQEALTNTLKHAGHGRARVDIAYGLDAVDLTIENDGGRVDPAWSDGRGLVGMRERVALYRGRLDAGPRDGGGFRVRAHLPLGAETA